MNIFVARQPIFDRDRRVVAYELLYRPTEQNSFGNSDTNVASLSTVEATLHGFGLEALVGQKLGFYNASRNLLLQEHWNVLPVNNTVIEVLETVEPDEAITNACKALKNAGYKLALDDFVFRPEYEGLLPYADYIKIDFLATTGDERAEMVRRFAPRGITMLAEKVETYQDFQEALSAGYHLFQGYFFCRPEMIAAKDVAAFKGNMARLIAEVNRPDLDFDALEDLIKQEVALSVKLLRYLRSAGFGWRHEVETIGQALRVLGERATRKWASLVALTMIGDDKPQELVTTSLVRAQFCEEVGAQMPGTDRRADLFLIGLLSTLDALLDKPLPTLLEQMSLSEDVSAALLGEATVLAGCLEMVVAYDRGDWARVDTLASKTGVAAHDLPPAYTRSVEWVGGLYANS